MSKEDAIEPSKTTIEENSLKQGLIFNEIGNSGNQNKDIDKSYNNLIFNNVNGLFISKLFIF